MIMLSVVVVSTTPWSGEELEDLDASGCDGLVGREG
jgi:hypothetical protein